MEYLVTQAIRGKRQSLENDTVTYPDFEEHILRRTKKELTMASQVCSSTELLRHPS